MNEPEPRDDSHCQRGLPTPTAATRTVRSDDLLAGGRQLLIDHDGQLYRLMLTKNGKLILQK